MHLDPKSLITATGYLGVFLIVFIETGLLVGFILPGDSLLFTAGFLASQHLLNLAVLIPLIFVAAVAGDNTGYFIGYRFGPRLFKRPGARLLTPANIARSQNFYAKHGGKTLILARYIPIVRTIVPPLAGMGNMPYRKFLMFDMAGCAVWATLVTLLGYYLGRTIPNVDKYLLPIVLLIVIISVSPGIIHLAKHPSERQRIIASLKQLITKRA